MIQEIVTTKAPGAIGPYSQGVAIGDLVFVSGQVPLSTKTKEIVKGGVKNETMQVLDNLRAILEAGGSDLHCVLKTTVYMTDLSKFSDMNEVYESYFEKPYPSRATIQVAALPKGAQVEIDCVAYIKRKEAGCGCEGGCSCE
jgi:2-iminobutanoate/2-iminopropanoate deaminase